jgi:hypothetical protein
MHAPLARRVAVVVAFAAFCAGVAAFYIASSRANGGFVFPLDDSYIHLGMASTLAEHGTWGINPGEFASATSSPLYTALLALALLVLGPHAQVALLLNVAAGAAVCALVARFAANTRERVAALLFVLVCVPLPFLAALGMEHVLHAALVLGLVRVGLGPPEARSRALLAGLSAAAMLTRYESVFVLLPLAAALTRRGRWGDAVVSLVAGGAAVAAYGAWSAAQGGLWLPNSIVMKSVWTSGWESLWRDNLGEGGAVLVLIAGAAAVAALDRRREADAVVFGVAALLHLGFARIGWLYRYEGYLLVWGGAVVMPVVARSVGSGAGTLLLGAILAPGAFRAWGGITGYVPCARTIHDNDVVLAEMVARELPGSTVAVHNIGALAWLTDARIVDVAGLATTEVTRLHLARTLDGAAIGAILAREGVALVYTDESWLASDLPPGITGLATLDYATPVARARTRLSSGPAGDPAALTRALRSLPAGGARYALEWPDAAPVRGAGLALEGPAVALDGDGVAFYSDGTATFTAARAGVLVFEVRGSPAGGRGPRFRVETAERVWDGEAAAETATQSSGVVAAGEVVRFRYADDAVDGDGNDRNLWITGLRIEPG